MNNIPKSLMNIDLDVMLRRSKIYEKQKQYKEIKAAAIPMARKMLKRPTKPETKVVVKQRRTQLSEEVIMAYWEKQIHIVGAVEDRFENKVQQFIQKIGHNFLAHLDSEVGNRKQFAEFLKKDYFDDNEDDLLTQATIDFAPLLDNVAILAGNEANKLIGVSDPYLLTNMRGKILDNIEFFTKSMLKTDREHLATIITNGLQDGSSIPEIRNLIEADFDQYSKMQATRITRTEVLRASNEAAVDAYRESGIVEGKEWLTAGADDECADYEGDVVGLDEEFADGDPPLHPNCRCVLLPVITGEKAYAPPINKANIERIKELEDQIDKRTKEFKELKHKALEDQANDKAYISALEKYLKVDDEQD